MADKSKLYESVDSSESRKALIKLIIVKTLCYLFLIFLTFMSFFFFYLLFINTTRSNNQLQDGGLVLIPSDSFFENLHNLFTSFRGEFNAVIGLKIS